MQHLSDALNEFLSEHALTAPRARARTPDFYDAFSAWAGGRAIPWASWAEISRELQSLGIPKGKHNGRMMFRGIILRGDPQATRWNCEPYTPRPQKPSQPVRTGRGAWTPGRSEWDAMRADLADLKASNAALVAEIRSSGAVKGARQARSKPKAAGAQPFLAGLEPSFLDRANLPQIATPDGQAGKGR